MLLKRFVGGLALYSISIFTVPALSAQSVFPVVTMSGRGAQNPLVASPADGWFNTTAERVQLEATVFPDSARSPHDSIDRMVAMRAQAWLARFQEVKPIQGMQLDNMAQLALAMGSDSLARKYFDQRLATPMLPVVDRVYTLITAASGFSDITCPERLPARIAVAKSYLFLLEKIPESIDAPISRLSYQLRWRIAAAYRRLGITDSLIVYGEDALSRLGKLPFMQRSFASTPLPIVAEALAGRANGREAIDRWSKYIKRITVPTAEDISADTNAVYYARSFGSQAAREMNAVALLGKKVPVVFATHWLNVANGVASESGKSLADGTVRLVMLGNFNCPHCIESMPMLGRLARRYGGKQGVEILYLTETSGVWGIESISPEAEVENLRKYYVETRRLTFPIAVWAKTRVQNEDGSYDVPESPNNDAFALRGTPSFYIVDGSGILRSCIRGYNGGTEQDLVDTFDAIIAEYGNKEASVR